MDAYRRGLWSLNLGLAVGGACRTASMSLNSEMSSWGWDSGHRGGELRLALPKSLRAHNKACCTSVVTLQSGFGWGHETNHDCLAGSKPWAMLRETRCTQEAKNEQMRKGRPLVYPPSLRSSCNISYLQNFSEVWFAEFPLCPRMREQSIEVGFELSLKVNRIIFIFILKYLHSWIVHIVAYVF